MFVFVGRKFKKVAGIGYPAAAMGMENMYPSAEELAEEEKAVMKIHKAFLSGKAFKQVLPLLLFSPASLK